MLSPDNQIDIFLFYPTKELFTVISDKELAIRLLKELPNSAAKCYFLWKLDIPTCARLDIIRMAIVENESLIYLDLYGHISDSKIRNYIMELLGYYARTEMFEYIYYNNSLPTIVIGAAKGGHRAIVNDIITSGRTTISHSTLRTIALEAAERGHIDIMNDMIDLGVNDYNLIANFAARGGHLAIVETMIMLAKDTMNSDNWETIAHYAAEGGHLDILEAMIKGYRDRNGNIVGAKRWRDIAMGAASGGQREIVHDMLTRMNPTISDLNCIAERAAYNGHITIVNDMTIGQNGVSANDYHGIAYSALYNGHLIVVKAMNELMVINTGAITRANDIDKIVINATKRGHLNIVKYIVERGTRNSVEILKTAVEYRKINIIEYITPIVLTDLKKLKCIT